MLNSPLSWMGGKYKLRKEIIRLIPEHKGYIEVFGGAAWVLFGKDLSAVEVYNDINCDLVNFFRIIKYHPEEFKKWIEKDVVSREIFKEYKDIPGKYLTDIQRAIRFYYLVKYSFASKGESFGYSIKSKPIGSIFKTSFIEDVRQRLSNCYIENLSFDEILNKYDRADSFFYLDPPYYGISQYKNKFYKEDHLKLVEMLKNINGLFLLTINDCDEVRDWYRDFYIKEVEVNYSISKEVKGRRKFKELIIANYNINKADNITRKVS